MDPNRFDTNWLIRAIEEAAIKQARMRLNAEKDYSIYGFTADQCIAIVRGGLRLGITTDMDVADIDGAFVGLRKIIGGGS